MSPDLINDLADSEVVATVSIVLPTYNRARFLPEAIESIRAQKFTDWELIVIDDGSTDETAQRLPQLTGGIPQPVKIVRQENQGFYAARNRGVAEADGKYLAFFDSDDLWLDYHLADCVDALERHADVDWVFSPSRIESLADKSILEPNTFYSGGQPVPFMELRCREAGRLRIIVDERFVECTLGGGLNCGLQGSLVRREVFTPLCRPVANARDISVDQYLVMRGAANGARFAYFDDVHVVYRVHDDNCSAANVVLDATRNIKVYRDQVDGLLRLREELNLTPSQYRSMQRRIANICFWQLGYASLWSNGRTAEGLAAFRQALAVWPWDWRYWKSYSLAEVRTRTPIWVKTFWWCLTDSEYRRQYLEMRQHVRRFQKLQSRAVKQILAQTGDRVLQGPFEGLIYTPARYGAFCAHVLLGTYEKELHPRVEEICKAGYKLILNLGAADGYYACGLALRNPHSSIIAFEANQGLHARISEFCDANGVENVTVAGRCDLEVLRSTIGTGEDVCIVCDIDGPERELLDQQLVPALANCDILVETHDMLIAGITDMLTSRFQASHQVTRIQAVPRTLDDVDNRVRLDPELALAAMDEHRGTDEQIWLWLVSASNAELVAHGATNTSFAQ